MAVNGHRLVVFPPVLLGFRVLFRKDPPWRSGAVVLKDGAHGPLVTAGL